MFDNLQVRRIGNGITESVYEDSEAGLKYTFYFYVYEGNRRTGAGLQMLSRVFAVPPRKMKGRATSSWSDSLRWDVYRATQHSVPVKEDSCNV